MFSLLAAGVPALTGEIGAPAGIPALACEMGAPAGIPALSASSCWPMGSTRETQGLDKGVEVGMPC